VRGKQENMIEEYNKMPTFSKKILENLNFIINYN
jgi:hypothetical protein